MKKIPCGRAAALAALCLTGALASASAEGYHLGKKNVLGGEGGWDYLTLDSEGRRLYISRATRVMVVDADTFESVGEIPDTPGVHGVAVAREFGRGFTSNGKADTVTIFDLQTLKTLGEVKTGKNPDAIIYDPASRRVFAFDGKSAQATAIDASSGAVAGTIALGGKPEFAVADGKGRVYVNLEDKNLLVALDSKKLRVRARWPLAPCEEPSGMALDDKNSRLFIGCGNKLMAVVDAKTGKVIAALPIGERVDANAFDPETGLAFSSNGDGTLTVVRAEGKDKFSVVDNVQTQKGSKTMALDPKTHRVFLAAADFGPAPAPDAEHPHPRPAMLPGTFTLLIFEK